MRFFVKKEYDMGEASAVCNGSQDGKVVAVMTTDAEGKVVSLLLTYDTFPMPRTAVSAERRWDSPRCRCRQEIFS